MTSPLKSGPFLEVCLEEHVCEVLGEVGEEDVAAGGFGQELGSGEELLDQFVRVRQLFRS